MVTLWLPFAGILNGVDDPTTENRALSMDSALIWIVPPVTLVIVTGRSSVAIVLTAERTRRGVTSKLPEAA